MIKNQKVIHNIDGDTHDMPVGKFLGVIVLAVILGVATGFGAVKVKSGSTSSPSTSQTGSTDKVSTTAGIADQKTFPDKAEGMLKDGGIEGEGSSHLERPGGASQNVYLTSSTVDLAQFTGKKVRVWGKTFSGKKAGWLMDVGYVEVLQ